MVASIGKTESITPKAKRSQIRFPSWRTVFAFIVWQMIAILFVEFVLYLAGLGEEEIFKFEAPVGFRHMHNKRITWRTEGFAQSYLDSDGMREPGLTIAKPSNTYRVAVLGDSMVEGYHVPIEQTFGALVGKSLSPLHGKQVQVLNFGTSGYSTAQEYLQLKMQVMKYSPDLVIVCYNSRDIFENWSAPDQVLTNVRPAAIHLPGAHLAIDTTPVERWLRTPRARFLRQIDWIREHSRIYGLFAAIDLELSQKDIWYRAFVNTVTHPKRIVNEFKTAWAAQQSQGPAFKIAFFEESAKSKSASDSPAAKPANTEVSNSTSASLKSPNEDRNAAVTAAQSTVSVKPTETPAVSAADTNKPAANNYEQFMMRTLGSLFGEMRAVSASGGAGFAVLGMPARAQLSPLNGMETTFAGIDYDRELQFVSQLCAEQKIPFLNIEKRAEALPVPQRESLFFVVHLSPTGQQFVAQQVAPFVKAQLNQLSASDLKRSVRESRP